jgi:hypothetical protein
VKVFFDLLFFICEKAFERQRLVMNSGMIIVWNKLLCQFQFEIISKSENHQLQFFENNQNLEELPVSSISSTTLEH